MTAYEALVRAQAAIETAMKTETDNVIRTHLVDAANACIRARDRITTYVWNDRTAFDPRTDRAVGLQPSPDCGARKDRALRASNSRANDRGQLRTVRSFLPLQKGGQRWA
jgi:hypothetical protein